MGQNKGDNDIDEFSLRLINSGKIKEKIPTQLTKR